MKSGISEERVVSLRSLPPSFALLVSFSSSIGDTRARARASTPPKAFFLLRPAPPSARLKCLGIPPIRTWGIPRGENLLSPLALKKLEAEIVDDRSLLSCSGCGLARFYLSSRSHSFALVSSLARGFST